MGVIPEHPMLNCVYIKTNNTFPCAFNSFMLRFHETLFHPEKDDSI